MRQSYKHDLITCFRIDHSNSLKIITISYDQNSQTFTKQHTNTLKQDFLKRFLFCFVKAIH